MQSPLHQKKLGRSALIWRQRQLSLPNRILQAIVEWHCRLCLFAIRVAGHRPSQTREGHPQVDYYRDHNPDLGVVGQDRLWAHFVLHGHQEMRAARFSCRRAAAAVGGLAEPKLLSSKALRLAQRLVVRRSSTMQLAPFLSVAGTSWLRCLSAPPGLSDVGALVSDRQWVRSCLM